MLMTLTKKQLKEREKELIQFCKDNHCLMWNYMITIKGIRNEVMDDLQQDNNAPEVKK